MALLAKIARIERVVFPTHAARLNVVDVAGNPFAAWAGAFDRLASEGIFDRRENLLECLHELSLCLFLKGRQYRCPCDSLNMN